jgi:hypothetical protein
MRNATRVSTGTVIATLLLAAQAAIGTLTAVVLFVSAHRWARVGAFAMEGVVAFAALTRIGVHPLGSLLTITYVAAVVALLVWRPEADNGSESERNGAPPESSAPKAAT